MPTPRWKLSDEQSLDSLNYDDASSLGEFFATAIAEGTGAKTSPKKAKYSRFRTTFWEEPLYNPEIAHGHINHAHEYLEKEQKKAWAGRGHQWSLSSDVRFRDNAYINPGPQKPERFPQCFEKPHKYWGRERKINPYARAKVYTRPNDRCKPWVKLTLLEEMADLGPGRYSFPDEWQKPAQPVCGVVRPSSFMMSRSQKGVPTKPAVGQEDHDRSSTEVEGCAPINDFSKIPRVRKPKQTSAANPDRVFSQNGFSFPRGAKSAMDDASPADLPVYHIRVREIATGKPCIVQVNSLTEVPEGYVNQETWANENLDGGVSLTLKKEPLPSLNPLEHDIDISVPDVALVPMPVTPLKKSKPCSPVQVQQMHLTTGTDRLILSPATSPHNRSGGGYLPTATHTLQSTNTSTQHSLFESTGSANESDGVVNWNHPIAKLHIPTTNPRAATSSLTVRSKTHGQRLHEREKKEQILRRQSEEPFSEITNRSRPNGSKFKKIPMHIADVASVKPTINELTESSSLRRVSSLREDSLGARSVGRKLRDTILLTASANNSTIINTLSESQF